MVYCCAYGCNNHSDVNKDVVYHCFPKNLHLRQQWVKAIRRKDFVPIKSTRICSIHFLVDDYKNTKLKPTAVPSIFNFAYVDLRKSKKVLAEEGTFVAEELHIAQPEHLLETTESNVLAKSKVLQTCCLSDLQPLLPGQTGNGCNTLIAELGLDSSQLEEHFEDSGVQSYEVEAADELDIQSNVVVKGTAIQPGFHEAPKYSCMVNFNAYCVEKATQTYFSFKCHKCLNNREKFKLVQQQLRRDKRKIARMKNKIARLKKELLENKKPKIKIVGYSVKLLDLGKSYNL